MTTYRILQYNTDDLRLGWDVFETSSNKADIMLLQRFPKKEYKELCNVANRAFLADSVRPNQLSLAICRSDKVNSMGGVETITLPSHQLVTSIGNPFQGSTALKIILGQVSIVSVLPCYPEQTGEYPVSEADLEKDIKFLLEMFKDTPTIVAGDFHTSPRHESINKLINDNGFKSYLDSHKTFKTSDGQMINLDRLLCNFDVDISDIIVHNTDNDIQQGHFPITYTLSWDPNQTD